MIVKMKKLTLLASESARQQLLVKLRRLGIVHIKHVCKPSAEEIRLLEETIARTQNAISILSSCAVESAAEKVSWQIQQIPDNVQEITRLAAEREDVIKGLQDIENQMEGFKPWGPFNPQDLKALEDKQIFIRLYRASKKAFKKIGERKDIQIINEDKGYVYLAQICQAPDAEHLPFEEVKLAKENFEDIYDRHKTFERRLKEIDGSLRIKARAQGSLKGHLAALENRYTFLNVKYGMKEEDGFLYLQGFCPVDNVKGVVVLAESEGFGYLIEEPDEPQNTPTLIRNPRWIRIINPIFKFMNTVPGYKEHDISFWFLAFFSIFFAMLIGDAGYGFLFLGLIYFARRKLKKMPTEPFILMYVLSIATIIWGALTGTWFGAEQIAKLPFFNSLIVQNINSFVDTNQEFIIYICFVIGVIQLSIAHFITAFRVFNSLKVLAEIGWMLTLWGLFYTAGTLVLNRTFPSFAGHLLIVGAALILFFSNPQKNILKGTALSLAMTPLKIISSFADVVSYIRLFAVGYATVAVASGFNKMALMLGFDSVTSSLGAAFIIIFGHSLNIILALMSIIVHGIRLNMLEFSGQIGLEWNGTEYNPFREQSEVSNAT